MIKINRFYNFAVAYVCIMAFEIIVFYELWRLRIAKPLNMSNVQGIDTFLAHSYSINCNYDDCGVINGVINGTFFENILIRGLHFEKYYASLQLGRTCQAS